MKKKLLIVLTVILLAAALFCLYMEAHFGLNIIKDTGVPATQISKEMPEACFSPQDFSMAEALFASQEIKDALKRVEGDLFAFERLPLETASLLLEEYVPEGYEVKELAVSGSHYLYVKFIKNDKREISYIFDEENIHLSPKKMVYIYGKSLFGDKPWKFLYEANGEITKYKYKHIWFYWLTGEI